MCEKASESMRVIQFDKRKYGHELFLDLGKLEESKAFFFEDTPHTVDFYELLFFQEASGTLQLDDQVIQLSNRQIVFASPYQRRIWKVDRSNIKGYYLIFENQFLEQFFADPYFVFRIQYFYNQHTPLHLSEDDVSFFNHQCAFEAMQMELADLKNDSNDFLRAFLLLILAGTNRKYAHTYGLSPDRVANTTAFQFKKLVEQRIRTLQKVGDYADLLNVSRVTINKMVKEQFRIPASQYIKTRLLTEVKRELLYTSKHVNEIAYDLNFSEPSSLIRFFKSTESRSPTEFRKAYQNVNSFIN